MTEFSTKAWEAKLAKRRKVRDFYRDKFFSDHGVKDRLKDPFDITTKSSVLLARVSELHSKSRNGLEGETSALDTLSSLMSETAFATDFSLTSAIGRPTLRSQSLSALHETYFSLPVPVRQKE